MVKVKSGIYISLNEFLLSVLILICGVSVGFFIGSNNVNGISILEAAMMVFGCLICCLALGLRQKNNT